MDQYLLVVAIVFAVNLMPAFGPPTWAVLTILQINLELAPVPVVLLGALAAVSGRLILALAARRFRGRMSQKRIEGLDLLAAELTESRTRGLAALGLFLVSPLPSAQLFLAAGLINAPLRPLAGAFLAGRLIAYSLYVGIATVAADGVGDLLGDSFTSPAGIALQVAMLAGLAALLSVDWARVLGDRIHNNDTQEPSA